MPDIPKPRKPGQVGGKHGQKHNAAASRARGGLPRAKSGRATRGVGSGGGGSKGGGRKFAPELWVLILIPLTIFTASGGLIWQNLV